MRALRGAALRNAGSTLIVVSFELVLGLARALVFSALGRWFSLLRTGFL